MATKDDALQKQITEYRMEALNRDSSLSESIQGVSSESSVSLTQFAAELDEFRDASVDFTAVIPNAMDSVVVIGEQGAGYFSSAGAGVIMDNRGLIVTNYHVIDEIGRITVKLNDGTDYYASVIGSDEHLDVSVIQLATEKEGFEYMEFADSDETFVGQHVIAIGNPVGFDSTVTEGIISNTNRVVNSGEVTYLQTDVAVNAGNSGGPLIDKEGDIIGIVTSKYVREGYEGLSFALKSNDVNEAVIRILREDQDET
jgi:serine protease Do